MVVLCCLSKTTFSPKLIALTPVVEATAVLGSIINGFFNKFELHRQNLKIKKYYPRRRSTYICISRTGKKL